jgi:hypothetical protein
MVFTLGSEGGRDIWRLPLDGDVPARPLVESRFDETEPEVSPDGRWLAYASNESGRYEVYVADLFDPSLRWQVTTTGGVGPAWAADGAALRYGAGADLMTVPVLPGGPGIAFGPPLVAFPGRAAGAGVSAADGRILKVVALPSRSEPSEVHVSLQERDRVD